MHSTANSGYTGLFNPSLLTSDITTLKQCIYCMSTEYNTAVVIIPLVPSFAQNVIDIARRSPSREIYIIAQDVGILFISEYYRAWYEITKNIKKNVHIVSAYLPSNDIIPSDFLASFIRNESNIFGLATPRSNLDTASIEIKFTQTYQYGNGYACDIIVNDGERKILFVTDMNLEKANFWKSNSHEVDEIHMNFIPVTYGGLSYNELMKEVPSLVNKVYVNQFQTMEEYTYVINRGLKVGKVFTE